MRIYWPASGGLSIGIPVIARLSRRIRKKLGPDSEALLETVPGVGYILHSPPADF
jgi:DNA-binding response OmpR family regulator